MVSSSENSKSPFRGLECLRPFKRGERYVAVATNKLYAFVKPWVSSLAWFQEPSSSMAHDVLWLSISSDHPDEIAVHMEDGRNPDGSEAGNTGSSPWPCSCRASPSLVSSLGLARLRCPVHLLVQLEGLEAEESKDCL